MATKNPYLGLAAATLASLQASKLAAIEAALTRGVSVSQPDVSQTFPSLSELEDSLALVNEALAIANGSANLVTVARLN